MKCDYCGTMNDDTAKYCSNCGADMSFANAGAQEPEAEKVEAEFVGNANENTYANYTPNYENVAVKDEGKNFAIASLVCGICSFFCCAFITGTLGIVFGAVAKQKGSKSPMATAGLVCGIIGIVSWLILMVL